MRVRHLICIGLFITATAVSGCATRPPGKILAVGKTYTAALSMAMLNFKVLSYRGDGWYSVQLLGKNNAPFTTKRPANINSSALSLLQAAGPAS